MAHEEEEKKRIYDETASLITRQAIMNKLNSEELHFLLNLLDHVVINNQRRPFIDVLHRWINSSVGYEIKDTIKNVLLNTDFNDETQLAASIQFIEELLCSSTEGP